MTLPLGKGYCDLNIPLDLGSDPREKLDVVRRALTLGYQTLALNVLVHQKDLSFKSKASKKKAKDDAKGLLDFPQPPVLKLEESDYPDLATRGKTPVILSRLTIAFTNNDFLPIFNNSQNAKKFDLIAIIPETAASLQNILKSAFRPDIIAFDHEKAQDIRWIRKLYNECVEKSIFFELTYAPMIRDSTARRRTISQGHNYHAVGKSKNIIICSEAQSPIELRGPHDVANMGFLLGLNENQCKAAVSHLSCESIRTAAGRRVGPYRATIVPLEDLPPEQNWKLPESDSSSGDSDMDDPSGDERTMETESTCK